MRVARDFLEKHAPLRQGIALRVQLYPGSFFHRATSWLHASSTSGSVRPSFSGLYVLKLASSWRRRAPLVVALRRRMSVKSARPEPRDGPVPPPPSALSLAMAWAQALVDRCLVPLPS